MKTITKLKKETKLAVKYCESTTHSKKKGCYKVVYSIFFHMMHEHKISCIFSSCLGKTTSRLVPSLKPASYNMHKGLYGVMRDLVKCAI